MTDVTKDEIKVFLATGDFGKAARETAVFDAALDQGFLRKDFLGTRLSPKGRALLNPSPTRKILDALGPDSGWDAQIK